MSKFEDSECCAATQKLLVKIIEKNRYNLKRANQLVGLPVLFCTIVGFEMFAEFRDSARFAVGFPSQAHISSVQNQPMVSL